MDNNIQKTNNEKKFLRNIIIVAISIIILSIGIWSNLVKKESVKKDSSIPTLNHKGNLSPTRIKHQTGHYDMSGYDPNPSNEEPNPSLPSLKDVEDINTYNNNIYSADKSKIIGVRTDSGDKLYSRSIDVVKETQSVPPIIPEAKKEKEEGSQAFSIKPSVSPKKNAYYSSTYQGGEGAKKQLEKMIEEGVVVDGKKVKLEAFSNNYTQTFPIPSDKALSLIASLERAKMVYEGGKNYLQVGIQATKQELPKRPPLNIALVIDKSGSMRDEGKILYVKDAAKFLIDKLNKDDVLSIVAYSSYVEIISPASYVTDPATLKTKIDDLKADGMTDIYSGLSAGYNQLTAYTNPNMLNILILLSDGQVTKGVSDIRAFESLISKYSDKDFKTTSIGVGLDFNDTLMMAISQAGKGNYHFIKDGADIEEIFKKELDELTHVVAKALKVRIVLDDSVNLVKVFGSEELSQAKKEAVLKEERRIDQKIYEELGIKKDREKDDEPGIKMFIPHFYLGDSYVIMLEIEVPENKKDKTLPIAQVFLKYKDLVTFQNREEKQDILVTYVENRDESIASIDKSVKKNILGFQTGEALIKASKLIQYGNIHEAVKVIDEQMVLLGVASKSWKDKDLEKDSIMLGKYKDILVQMAQVSVISPELKSYLQKSLTFAGYQRTK